MHVLVLALLLLVPAAAAQGVCSSSVVPTPISSSPWDRETYRVGNAPFITMDATKLKFATLFIGVTTSAHAYAGLAVMLNERTSGTFDYNGAATIDPAVAEFAKAKIRKLTNETGALGPPEQHFTEHLPDLILEDRVTSELYFVSNYNGPTFGGSSGWSSSYASWSDPYWSADPGMTMRAWDYGDVNADGYSDVVFVRGIIPGFTGLLELYVMPASLDADYTYSYGMYFDTLPVLVYSHDFSSELESHQSLRGHLGLIDVNLDGKLDYIVMTSLTELSCLINSVVIRGDTPAVGTASPCVTLTAGYTTDRMTMFVVDVNADGFDDLVLNADDPTTNTYGSTFFVVTHSGTSAGFDAPVAIGTIGERVDDRSIAFDDIDGDGFVDMAYWAAEVRKALVVRYGGLAAPAFFGPEILLWSNNDAQQMNVAITYVTGSDLPDIVILQRGYATGDFLHVFRTGTGLSYDTTIKPVVEDVASAPSYASAFLQYAFVDWNSDGHLDLAVPAPNTAELRIYPRTAGGTVGLAVSPTVVASVADAAVVATGEFTGDFAADAIVFGHAAADNALSATLVAAADTTGTLLWSGVTLATPDVYLQRTFTVDWNGDGSADVLLVAINSNLAVFVAYGSPGGLAQPVPILDGGDGGYDATALASKVGAPNVAVGDVDGDGTPDVVVSSATSHPVVCLNDGDGVLDADTTVVLRASPGSAASYSACLALGDIDGDGDLDLIAQSQSDESISYALNDGSGIFDGGATSGAHVIGNVPTSLNALRVVDMNGDGAVSDIAFVSSEGVAGFWLHATGVSPLQYDTGTPPLYVVPVIEGSGPQPLWIDAVPIEGDDAIAEFFVGLSNVGTVSGYSSNGVSVLRSSAAGGSLTSLVPAAASAQVFPMCATKSMACVASLLGRVSACKPAVLTLEPGEYPGCPTTARMAITGTVTIRSAAPPAKVVFNCTTSGGALFDVIDGASLTLEHVAMVGATGLDTASASLRATTPILVSGTSSVLTLTSVSVSRCSSRAEADMTSVQLLPGFGGFAVADTGATIYAADSVFDSNTAGDAGGVFGVAGSGSSLLASGCTFSNNAAPFGASIGGAVAAGLGAPVVALEDCVFDSNSAAIAGGAVAATDPRVRITAVGPATAFVRNTAAHGGAIALLPSSTYVLPRTFSSTAVLPGALGLAAAIAPLAPAAVGGAFSVHAIATATAAAPATFTLAGPTPIAMSGNTAAAGGVVFACDAHLVIDAPLTASEPNAATAAGAFAFTCLPSDALAQASAGPVASVLFVTSGAGVAAAAVAGAPPAIYGPVMASPGAAVAFTADAPLPESAQSGVGLAAEARMTDLYGNDVVDASVLLALELTDAAVAAGVAFSGLEIRVLSQATVSFAGLSLTASPALVPSLPFAADLRLVLSGTALPASAVPSESDTVSVTLCGISFGSVGEATEPLVCVPCTEDTFSTEESAAPCDVTQTCPPGVVRINGNCTECPAFSDRQARFANATTDLTGATYIPCSCLPGYHSPTTSLDTACVPCPTGGVCGGGLMHPVADAGFFDTSAAGDGSSFSACLRQSACVGAASGTCAPGHLGYMCNTCAESYYSGQDKQCHKCPDGTQTVVVAFAAVIVVGGVLVAAVAAIVVRRRNKRVHNNASDSASDNGEDQHQRTLVNRARSTVPRSLALALTLAQVLGLLGSSSEIGWPSSTKSALSVFEVANLDIHFATECSFDSFSTKYILSLAYPLVFVAVAVVACGILRLCAPAIGAKVSVVRVLEKIVFVGGPLLYIPLARSALVLFDCTQLPNGKWALDADLSRECFSDAWWSLVPFGIVGFALYVVLVPAVIGGILFGFRARLLDAPILARYGSIYHLFRVSWAPFELVVLVKKLAIISATLFLSTYPLWMIFAVASVFGVFSLVHARHDVYLAPTYNVLEVRLNSACFVILILAFAFYADRFPSSAARSLFAYLAIAVVVVAFLLLIHAFVKELNGLVGSSQGDVREAVFWSRFEGDAANFADPELIAAVNLIRLDRGRDELPLRASHPHARSIASPSSSCDSASTSSSALAALSADHSTSGSADDF